MGFATFRQSSTLGVALRDGTAFMVIGLLSSFSAWRAAPDGQRLPERICASCTPVLSPEPAGFGGNRCAASPTRKMRPGPQEPWRALCGHGPGRDRDDARGPRSGSGNRGAYRAPPSGRRVRTRRPRRWVVGAHVHPLPVDVVPRQKVRPTSDRRSRTTCRGSRRRGRAAQVGEGVHRHEASDALCPWVRCRSMRRTGLDRARRRRGATRLDTSSVPSGVATVDLTPPSSAVVAFPVMLVAHRHPRIDERVDEQRCRGMLGEVAQRDGCNPCCLSPWRSFGKARR